MGSGRKGQDAQTLRWKPQMKNAAKRSCSLSTTGTAHVADQALANIRSIDKLRAQGHAVDDPYVAKLAGRGKAPAAEATTKPSRGVKKPPAGSRTLLIAAAAVACTVAGTAVVFAMGGFSSTYTVAGRIWLERRPLGTAELRFHSADHTDSPATVVAVTDGKFELKGVPSGKYRVTVHPPTGASKAVIATTYTKPESTPLQVNVSRDVNSLQFYAYKVLPKSRK